MNDSIPLGWVILVALTSGVVAAIITAVIGRLSTLRAVKMANDSALAIARENDERAHALEWLKWRREMIQKLAVDFVESAHQGILLYNNGWQRSAANAKDDRATVALMDSRLIKNLSIEEIVRGLLSVQARTALLDLDCIQGISGFNQKLTAVVATAASDNDTQFKANIDELTKLHAVVVKSIGRALK